MGMLDLVEVGLSWVFQSARGRDEKSFYRSPAFADFPQPTIEMTSPDNGPGSLAAPAKLRQEHSADGAGIFPSLEWKAANVLQGKVKEWLLVCEDPDAPLPTPLVHGWVYSLYLLSTEHDAFEPVELTGSPEYTWESRLAEPA